MDQVKGPPPGCTVLVTTLDGSVREARCRGLDGGDLYLFTRDGRPEAGITVVLRWDHAGEAYEAAGVVADATGSAAAWRVQVTQAPVSARCRRHPRVPVHLPVRIAAAGTGGEVIAEGIAVDISAGGLRVILTRPAELTRGDEIEVVLSVDGTVLRCPTRLAHTAADRGDTAVSEYGIVFAGLPPAAAAVVHALVESALAPSGPQT